MLPLGPLDLVERVALRLPYAVYTETEALAQPFEFRIGNFEGNMWTPAPWTSGRPKSRLSPPPGAFDWVDHPNSSTDVDWGYRNSESASTIRTLCLDFEHPDSDAGDSRFPWQFPKSAWEWMTTLQAWLSVLSSGPTDIAGNSFLTWMDWEIEVEYLSTDQYSWVFPDYPLALEQWQFAVMKANQKLQAPAPLTLLAAAQRAIAEGDPRSAVIDGTTAVELALTEAIRAMLTAEGAREEIQNELLKRKTLGALVELSKKLGLVLPAETSTDVVGVRNKVVHATATLSEIEVRKALSLASTIVRTNYPLDDDISKAITMTP